MKTTTAKQTGNFDYNAAAAQALARAEICEARASRNWVRNGPGDEQVARRYWLEADVLRARAASYQHAARAGVTRVAV